MTKEISVIDQAKKQIISNEKAFAAVLPKNFDVQKFMATFCLEVQKNEKLAQCTNLIEVARDVANFGLVIGGLANQAHLIPYQNYKTKKYSAQLIIGYRGYITKFEEAGYSVEVELVTNAEIDGGFFEEIRGSDPKIIHRPIRKGIRDRDNIALAYCIVKSPTGSQVISVLSKEEIEEMAKTSQWVEDEKTGKKTKEIGLSNVWLNKDRTTDFGQMCLKTVIRNVAKKVNLKIANEMSAYEGQRDAEIMRDVTPLQSKTAALHNPPANLEAAFAPKVAIVQEVMEQNDNESPSVNTLFSDQVEEIKEPSQEEKDEAIFKELKEYVLAAGFKTAKAVDMFLNVTHKEKINSIQDVALKAEILALAGREKEKIKQ